MEMDNEYLARSIFLESLVVGNFMKARLDKIVVIRMESRQSKRNQRKLKLGYLKRIEQTLVVRRKKIF